MQNENLEFVPRFGYLMSCDTGPGHITTNSLCDKGLCGLGVFQNLGINLGGFEI